MEWFDSINYIRSGWVGATLLGGGPVELAASGTPFTPSHQQRTSEVSHGTFCVTGSRVNGLFLLCEWNFKLTKSQSHLARRLSGGGRGHIAPPLLAISASIGLPRSIANRGPRLEHFELSYTQTDQKLNHSLYQTRFLPVCENILSFLHKLT